MFLNRTYVKIMSFSDHLVTFKFEGISILHLTVIFSDNFIIFWDFLWFDQNRYVFNRWTPSVGVEIIRSGASKAETETVGDQPKKVSYKEPTGRANKDLDFSKIKLQKLWKN